MVATTPSSRKSKGKEFQNWVRSRLITVLGLDPEDIESTSMGAPGIDIKLAKAARATFPFAVECKRTESFQIWSAIEQSKKNAGPLSWCVVAKRNRMPPIVVLDFETFLELQQKSLKIQPPIGETKV